MKVYLFAMTVGLAAGVVCAGNDKGNKPDKGDGADKVYMNGLVAHYFKDPTDWNGNWMDDVSVPDVFPSDWTFTDYAYSRVEPLVNHRFINEGWFSVRWVGYLDTSAARRATDGEDAEYSFQILADDGCRLTVDGVVLIDDWRPCWEGSVWATRVSRSIKLSDGKHRIVVEYFQGQSLSHSDRDPIKLMWSSEERGIKKQSILPAAYFSHTAEDLLATNP